MKVKELRKALEGIDGEKEVRIISKVTVLNVAETAKVTNLYLDPDAFIIKSDNTDPWYPNSKIKEVVW